MARGCCGPGLVRCGAGGSGPGPETRGPGGTGCGAADGTAGGWAGMAETASRPAEVGAGTVPRRGGRLLGGSWVGGSFQGPAVSADSSPVDL